MSTKYDFSKVAEQAAKFISGEASNEFKYKLVYPGVGKLKFRILFNPKSGLVTRLITRHNIDGTKIPCASTYSKRDDCPICKALADIANMGKTYPREYGPTTRAILFAQFVSADYEVAGGKLNKGDVFILMVPYTIYKQIMKWITDFSNDSAIMARVFGSREYSVQVIERGKEATDWNFRPDPNITLESAKSDQEFSDLLESLDSLYTQLGFHEKITPEEVALMQTTAEGLVRAFISGSNANPEGYTPPAPPVEDRPKVENNPTSVSGNNFSAPTSEKAKSVPAGDRPSCYGQYVGPENTDPEKKRNQTRCKFCPVNTICKSDSNSDKNGDHNDDLPF